MNIILLLRRIMLSLKRKSNKPFLFVNEIFHPGTKVLNGVLDKCKTHGDKWGLGYINKDETPCSGENVFVKGKYETPTQVAYLKNPSLCTHYKKTGHTQFRCYIKFLERFESQMSRLMNDFNSFKNNILNNGKVNKPNQKPRSQPSSFKSLPKIKQDWMRNDRNKCQVVFIILKARSISEWYFDSGYSRHITGDKSFFTSLEDHNGGTYSYLWEWELSSCER